MNETIETLEKRHNAAVANGLVIQSRSLARRIDAMSKRTENCRSCDLTYPAGTEHKCTDGWERPTADDEQWNKLLARFAQECDDALNTGIRPGGGDELRAWNYVVRHFQQVIPLIVAEHRAALATETKGTCEVCRPWSRCPKHETKGDGA